MLLMGKLTISTGPFSIAMLNYQRVAVRHGFSMALIEIDGLHWFTVLNSMVDLSMANC